MEQSKNGNEVDVSDAGEKKFDAYKYVNDFKKEHYKRVSALIPRADKKTLDYLSKQESVSAYIYGLIQQDIKRSESK